MVGDSLRYEIPSSKQRYLITTLILMILEILGRNQCLRETILHQTNDLKPKNLLLKRRKRMKMILMICLAISDSIFQKKKKSQSQEVDQVQEKDQSRQLEINKFKDPEQENPRILHKIKHLLIKWNFFIRSWALIIVTLPQIYLSKIFLWADLEEWINHWEGVLIRNKEEEHLVLKDKKKRVLQSLKLKHLDWKCERW